VRAKHFLLAVGVFLWAAPVAASEVASTEATPGATTIGDEDIVKTGEIATDSSSYSGRITAIEDVLIDPSKAQVEHQEVRESGSSKADDSLTSAIAPSANLILSQELPNNAAPATVSLPSNSTEPSAVFPLTIAPSANPILSQELPNNAAPATVSLPSNSTEPSAVFPLTQVNVQANGTANEGMRQVTSVSQLSDVQPTDWAFQALQSLVERYGCIAGYPDGTFRGNRALTRYEFAAGLNACLDQVTKQIGANTANLITKEDLAILQKLQEEFATELASLRGRVDALEARTAELQANQFSTTTILGGEVIFGLAAARGGNPPGKGNNNVIFGHLTRLQLTSSFTGKDRLRIQLASGNFSNGGFASADSLGTNQARLSYQTDLNNNIALDLVEYRFPAFSDRVVFTVRPVGFSLSSVLTANSPYFDTGRGAISRFAEASPLFKIGNLEAGVGVDWLLTRKLRLQLAYGTANSSSPAQGNGFVASDRSALGVQLLVKPAATISTGITYINAYSKSGFLETYTGSINADTSGGINQPSQINAFGGTLQWRITPKLNFATWGGWINSDSTKSNAFARTTTYMFTLGLIDPLGREGDLLAFVFGQPPRLVDGRELGAGKDRDTSLHFELFYRLRVNDNISVTPGFFVVTNPENNANNKSLFVGTVRTTFSF